MARRKFHAPELLRSLEAANYPIYILDGDRHILFANQACLDWLGVSANDLIGRQCCYHSAPADTRPMMLASQLCPPPTALQGETLSADIALFTEAGMIYRQARFLPLAIEGDEPLAVIVVVDSHDSPAPTVSPAEPSKDEALILHEQLQNLHAESKLRYGLERIVGNSPAMRRARAQAAVAVASSASVLLWGPAGSGRRHMASSIHASIAKSDGSVLVPIDCPVLTTESLVATVQNLVARPAVGRSQVRSLLLCDVDRLAADAHAPLAAIFRAGNFRLRLMSTSSAPLVELARRKLYSEELAAMLSTITIELPSLAERRQDLPQLAQALIEQANARGGKQLGGFTPEALDRLHAYSWFGNVTELAEVVDACHAASPGPFIPSANLPEKIRLSLEAGARPRRKDEPIVLDEFLAKVERELIERALARAKNNKARAARMLGLTRPRLYRRMVQLGLIAEGGEK